MIQDFEQIFNQSYERVNKAHKPFFQLFYEKFLLVPGVAEKFLDTDFQHQRLMLRQSLLGMVEFAIRGREDNDMEALSRSHNQRHISPDLYDVWLEALIETVVQCDRQFDASVEEAWRTVLAPGIAYMKESAQTAVQPDIPHANS